MVANRILMVLGCIYMICMTVIYFEQSVMRGIYSIISVVVITLFFKKIGFFKVG